MSTILKLKDVSFDENGYGDSYGSGSGYGDGYGDGYGSGSGYGDGDGSGDGEGGCFSALQPNREGTAHGIT